MHVTRVGRLLELEHQVPGEAGADRRRRREASEAASEAGERAGDQARRAGRWEDAGRWLEAGAGFTGLAGGRQEAAQRAAQLLGSGGDFARALADGPAGAGEAARAVEAALGNAVGGLRRA